MFSGEYRRLYATCLTMAEQSNLPEARARWLALAKDCENLVKGDQSKLRATRLTHAEFCRLAACKRLGTTIRLGRLSPLRAAGNLRPQHLPLSRTRPPAVRNCPTKVDPCL
jgi:hypothetical protein